MNTKMANVTVSNEDQIFDDSTPSQSTLKEGQINLLKVYPSDHDVTKNNEQLLLSSIDKDVRIILFKLKIL
jgi:hypothetical protein